MSVRQPSLLLLDAHSMVYRAWYAIQNPLTVSTTGEEVRGVHHAAPLEIRGRAVGARHNGREAAPLVGGTRS